MEDLVIQDFSNLPHQYSKPSYAPVYLVRFSEIGSLFNIHNTIRYFNKNILLTQLFLISCDAKTKLY